MGCGHDPDVDRDRTMGADPFYGTFLQHPQQFDLDFERQVTDLIQEQSATLGALESADSRSLGSGEGPSLVSEELALQKSGGECRGVDGDERSIGSWTGSVDGTGQELLAGAAFAHEKHGDVGRSNPSHAGERFGHGAPSGDEAGQRLDLTETLFQFSIFAA